MRKSEGKLEYIEMGNKTITWGLEIEESDKIGKDYITHIS